MGGGSFPIRKIMLRFFGKGKALRAPISRTKAQHFFPKIGWGGGSEAVWKFSENSSNLVQVNVPKLGSRNDSPISLLCWDGEIILIFLC